MPSRCLGDVSFPLPCFRHPKTALKIWNTFFVFRARVWKNILGTWTSPYVACLHGPSGISYLTWQLVAMKKDCCCTQYLETVPNLLYASDNRHWLWKTDCNWWRFQYMEIYCWNHSSIAGIDGYYWILLIIVSESNFFGPPSHGATCWNSHGNSALELFFPDIQGHVPAMTDPSSGSSVCRARVARSSAHETVDPKAETRS